MPKILEKLRKSGKQKEGEIYETSNGKMRSLMDMLCSHTYYIYIYTCRYIYIHGFSYQLMDLLNHLVCFVVHFDDLDSLYTKLN